jgi:hypothetical protein
MIEANTRPAWAMSAFDVRRSCRLEMAFAQSWCSKSIEQIMNESTE